MQPAATVTHQHATCACGEQLPEGRDSVLQWHDVVEFPSSRPSEARAGTHTPAVYRKGTAYRFPPSRGRQQLSVYLCLRLRGNFAGRRLWPWARLAGGGDRGRTGRRRVDYGLPPRALPRQPEAELI